MPEVISDVERAQTMLRREIDAADQVVGFTGAGISTESGVPDFRSPGSPWLRHPPIDFKTFCASAAARTQAWRRKFAIDDAHAGACPNRGHAALAALIETGKMTCIITQNIDGLHQASGSPPDRIIELHGNGTYAICLACLKRHELSDVRRALETTGAAPQCTCGGPIKSATVSFGQAIPKEVMAKAWQAALSCGLFVVLGSSLLVHPAAALPRMAKENGSRLVIVNRESTPLDSLADLVIRGELGATLAHLGTACTLSA